MPIRAALFDAFQTLIDLHPSYAGAFANVCRRFGHDVSPRDIEAVLPDVEARHHQRHQPHRRDWRCNVEELNQRWLDYDMLLFNALGIDDHLHEMARDMETRFNSGEYAHSYEDAEPVLRALRNRGLTIGIVSNGTAGVMTCMQALGYEEWTDFILVSALFGFEKPAPEIFAEACRLADVSPDEAMFVGDNLKVDCEGAQNAGMLPVWLRRNGDNPASVPFPQIQSLYEVEDLIS